MCSVEVTEDIAVGLLDCVSAYNHMQRTPILEEVAEDCGDLLAFAATFLCRKGVYVFYDDSGVAHLIESADGVEQGAAISPALFALGMRRALRRIRARLEALLEGMREQGQQRHADAVVRLLSYLDDLTLLVPTVMMRVAVDVAREELASIGLLSNGEKTKVWAKSGRCPPGCEVWWRGPDGFVISGAPFGRVADPADPP
jgi:hypothetical protein